MPCFDFDKKSVSPIVTLRSQVGFAANESLENMAKQNKRPRFAATHVKIGDGPVTSMPDEGLQHLFNRVLPRVKWFGSQEEAGEVAMNQKETRAKISDALTHYIQKNQCVSLFKWFRERKTLLKWHHPIQDPVTIVFEQHKTNDIPAYVKALVTCETTEILAEESLMNEFEKGDTCKASSLDRVKSRAIRMIGASITSTLSCDAVTSHKIIDLCKEMVECHWPRASEYLWRTKIEDKIYYSTRERGLFDRKLMSFFTNRTFHKLPAWKAEDSCTDEQRHVFDDVMSSLREHGWGTLVGPGGSGKTHMMKSLAQRFREYACTTPAETVGSDCPHCGYHHAVSTCRQCGRQVNYRTGVPHAYFLAPTNRAVSVLTEAIQSTDTSGGYFTFATLHAISCCNIDKMEKAHLVVIDEASMLSSEHGDILVENELFEDAAILFVGDDLQLPPVGAGEIFRVLLRHRPTLQLTRNMRADKEIDGIVQQVRRGEIENLQEAETRCNDINDMFIAVDEWKPDVVLAFRNDERVKYVIHRMKQKTLNNPRLVALDDYRKNAETIPKVLRALCGVACTNANQLLQTYGMQGCPWRHPWYI